MREAEGDEVVDFSFAAFKIRNWSVTNHRTSEINNGGLQII